MMWEIPGIQKSYKYARLNVAKLMNGDLGYVVGDTGVI